MYADRTLAAVGVGIVFCGGVLSLLVSQYDPQPAHDGFAWESLLLIACAAVGAFFVFMRLFKALWLVVVAAWLIFAVCVWRQLTRGFDTNLRANGQTVAMFVHDRLVSNLLGLLTTHVGWPVAIVGVALTWWVARGVDGKLFDVTPKSGIGVSVFSPNTSLVVSEILDAPKWPLTTGSILIMTGIIVLNGHEIPIARKLAGLLVSELGFAFFIAFVIGLTIEIRSHAERDKQVSRGILSYVYGVSLDDRMFLAAEEHIFKYPFFRDDLEIGYTFLRTSGDKVLLKYSISYAVRNVSRKPLEFPIHTFVEKPSQAVGTHQAFPDASLGLQRIAINGAEVGEEQLAEARKTSPDTDTYIQSVHRTPIRPGEQSRVMCVLLLEKNLVDSELWRSVVPSSGVTLRIDWPETLRLNVKACAIHPADDADAKHNGFDFMAIDGTSLVATLDEPFFPANGIQFWWGCEQATEGEAEGVAEQDSAAELAPTHQNRETSANDPKVSFGALRTAWSALIGLVRTAPSKTPGSGATTSATRC